MNFDRLAGHYPWLEKLFAGSLIQRCRITFLAHARNCQHALLVGEGTGKFMVALLRLNPQVRITCIESCAGMIRQMRQRLRREQLDGARVQFKQVDALGWMPPTEKFDLVVTNFFLDCFRAEQLARLIPRLAESATGDAVWLLADFCVPERGWQRWRARGMLLLLYGFFKWTTSLSANWLTPPDTFLAAAGFTLIDRQRLNFGFAHADLWARGVSNFPGQTIHGILRA